DLLLGGRVDGLAEGCLAPLRGRVLIDPVTPYASPSAAGPAVVQEIGELVEQFAGGELLDDNGDRLVGHFGAGGEVDAGGGGDFPDQLAEGDLGFGVGDRLVEGGDSGEGRALRRVDSEGGGGAEHDRTQKRANGAGAVVHGAPPD